MKRQITHTITCNYSKRTYTIREYDEDGKLLAKYRSYPQGEDFSDNWTENDIKSFLRSTEDYYKVR